MPKYPEYEDMDLGAKTKDETDRHSNDSLLRSHGFTIHSRPKVGEPSWCVGKERQDAADVLVSESEALRLIRNKQRKS